MSALLLATYGAIGVEELDRCPRVDHERIKWVHRDTGEIRLDRCRAMKCPFCSPNELKKTAAALAHGGTTGPPTHAFRLTLDGHDWPRLRQKMKNLPRYLENQGCKGFQATWVVHQGGRGRYHIHGMTKGCSNLTHARLEATWGSGVFIERITSASASAQYLFHHADDHPAVLRHLDLNGGRAEHHSRDYFGSWNLRETRAHIAPHSDDWIRISA